MSPTDLQSGDVDLLFTPLASRFCRCWDGKDLCVYPPCVCVLSVGDFCVSCLWMNIQCFCSFRAKEQVELQTTLSQQSLSCHWPAATWADSSSAKLFKHTCDCVFTWVNLAPVRDESLIWRLTAPLSFKFEGLLTSFNNCLEVDDFFFF